MTFLAFLQYYIHVHYLNVRPVSFGYSTIYNNSFSTETAKLFLTFCQSRCFTYSALLRTSYLMAVLFLTNAWEKVLSSCKDKLWWRAKTRWKSRPLMPLDGTFHTSHKASFFSHLSISCHHWDHCMHYTAITTASHAWEREYSTPETPKCISSSNPHPQNAACESIQLKTCSAVPNPFKST